MFDAKYVEFIFYKTLTIKICMRVWKIIIVVSVLFFRSCAMLTFMLMLNENVPV